MIQAVLATPALLVACSPGPIGSILFYSDRSGNGDIYALDLATRELTRWTDGPEPEFAPRWTGSLVHVVEGEAGQFLASRDEPVTERFDLFANPAGDESPAWSADGTQLAYPVAIDGFQQLWIAQDRGRTGAVITDGRADHRTPSWSPQGTQLALISNVSGSPNVCLISRDGTGFVNLTGFDGIEGHPSWSPDGTRIVFDRVIDGVAQICVLTLEDRSVRVLTDEPANSLVARFSPDGDWITFGSTRGGNWDLYLMRSDGTDVQRLTDHPGFDGDAIWITDSASNAPDPRSTP